MTFTTAYTYAGNYLTQGVLNIHNAISGNGPYSDNIYPDHNLSVTATYEIPGIKTPGQMLQGWQLHTNIGVISAYPVLATDANSKDDLTGAALGAGQGTPWTLYGSADPFSQLFGRAGTIPCYGVAVAVPSERRLVLWFFDCPVPNLPAACIAAATTEPSFPGLTAANVTLNTANGLPLNQLAAIGCYMVNGSAIVPPAQGTYGTMLPDAIKGPGLGLVDASITKEWKFKERFTTQFRAEVFNLFNRTQYLGAKVDLGSPSTFGLSTNTPDVTRGDPIQGRGGPREFQFGLKLLF